MGLQPRTRALALALILALSLTAGGALASPPGHSGRSQAAAPQGILEALWSWLAPWLTPGGGATTPAKLQPIWQNQEEGCGMDPNGNACPHIPMYRPDPNRGIPGH